jgi:hypothetical protein
VGFQLLDIRLCMILYTEGWATFPSFSSSLLYPRHGQADPFIPLELLTIRDAENTGVVDYCKAVTSRK